MIRAFLSLLASLAGWLFQRKQQSAADEARAPVEAAEHQLENAEDDLRKAQEAGQKAMQRPVSWDEMNRQ